MRGEIFFENFWNGVIVNMMGGEFFYGCNDIFCSLLQNHAHPPDPAIPRNDDFSAIPKFLRTFAVRK